MRLIRFAALSAVATVCAACSSSGTAAGASTGPGSTQPGIGQVVPPATTSGPAGAADLGKPITQGALTLTVSGPVTAEKNGDAVLATFHVTMANVSAAGDVVGPDWFGIRCDANRDDRMPGDEMSTTTVAGDKHIAAGKTVSGIAVVAWLKWNTIVKCTGVTTIEARFLKGGFVAWALPADVVAKVNASVP